jgi:uncharacterized protein (DUF4415 family)
MKENKKSIMKQSKKSSKHSLTSKNNEAYSEIPETDAEFWAHADIHIPRKKEMITLRLDPEVLEYFKSSGGGYQTKMNAILKSYVDAHPPGTQRL